MFLFGGTGRGLVLAGSLTILLLVSLCPTGVQGDQTCSCTGGCAPNQACESATSCKKENVAYGKSASISSVYNGSTRSAGPACVAVNGRTGHVMKFAHESGPNCVHTTTSDNNASWSVDLGRDYTVTDIVIYSREEHASRLAGIWIYVDNNICMKFPSSTLTGYNLTYTAVCDSPLRGQIVNFTKKGPTDRPKDYKFINFCEVQIWVCKSGTFGQQCNQTCHCKGGLMCDSYYGNCTSGCADGYYGNTCSAICGQCHDDAVCDDGNGHCPGGCKPGYQPPFCQNTCPGKTYGDSCTQRCGQCKDGAACNVFNGTCPTCRGKFSPPLCKDCVDGYYGDMCSTACGQCLKDAVCDKDTGHCPGGCRTGYQPPLCHDTCPGKTYGDNCRESCGQCKDGAACNVFNGTCPTCEGNFSPPLCKSCGDGSYDDTCTETCGQCKDGAVCDASKGHCPNGCEAGYGAPLCQDTCPDKTYGDSCTQTCGQCKDGAACNVFNGTCPTCRGNFSPPLCKGCLAGYYGDACTGACGHCTDGAVCDASNGHCSNGCETGYAEPLCLDSAYQDTKMPFNAGTIVGVTVAVMIFIFTIIVVTAVVWMWRRKWVLPCAEANPRPADEEMEYRGTHASRGEQGHQRDTGIYEIPDAGECSPPSELNPKPPNYDQPQTSDMGQKSVYSSLSAPNHAGRTTGPSNMNKPETSSVYVNQDNSEIDKDNSDTHPVYVNDDNVMTSDVYVNKKTA